MAKSSSTALISVVVPHYNLLQFLPKALHSVNKQTHDQWEILLIDDAGSECPETLLKSEFRALLGGKIVFKKNPENLGVAATRNRAIEIAKGDLIAFLDPDDWWPSDFLESQLSAVSATGQPHYTRAHLVDGDGSPTGVILGPETKPSASHASGDLSTFNFVPLSSVVIPRDLLLEVGSFDSDRGIDHVEDWDLWLRLQEQGHALNYNPDPVTYYRKHEAGATSPSKRRSILHSMANLCAKHPHNSALRNKVMHDVLDVLDQSENQLTHLRSENERMQSSLESILDSPTYRMVRRIHRWRALLSR